MHKGKPVRAGEHCVAQGQGLQIESAIPTLRGVDSESEEDEEMIEDEEQVGEEAREEDGEQGREEASEGQKEGEQAKKSR